MYFTRTKISDRSEGTVQYIKFMLDLNQWTHFILKNSNDIEPCKSFSRLVNAICAILKSTSQRKELCGITLGSTLTKGCPWCIEHLLLHPFRQMVGKGGVR